MSWSFTQSMGLLGRGISQSQGHYLTKTQNKRKQTSISWVGFQLMFPVFWAAEDSSCLRPRGHCDRLPINQKLEIPLSFLQVTALKHNAHHRNKIHLTWFSLLPALLLLFSHLSCNGPQSAHRNETEEIFSWTPRLVIMAQALGNIHARHSQPNPFSVSFSAVCPNICPRRGGGLLAELKQHNYEASSRTASCSHSLLRIRR
jgi:hypothetical protein